MMLHIKDKRHSFQMSHREDALYENPYIVRLGFEHGTVDGAASFHTEMFGLPKLGMPKLSVPKLSVPKLSVP